MEKLLLVDGHSILSRAFFGIPRLTTGDGRPTNAVYGFMNILLKAVEDEAADYIAVAFDVDRRELKRTKLYPEYKGTRRPMPEELTVQISKAAALLKAMNVPVCTLRGYEADDIIGTAAKRAMEEGMEVTVLSGDRDLLQLASEKIKIMIPKTSKGRTEVISYYPDDVKREYGVTPSEFIDVKALMGDSSDNIPGLPGVGEKTAKEIIGQFGSIENALKHVEEIRPPRAQAAFREHFDLARLSKILATIDTEVPVETDLKDGRTSEIYTEAAVSILRDLELKTLVSRFTGRTGKAEGAGKNGDLPACIIIIETDGEAADIFSRALCCKHAGISLFVSEAPAEMAQLSLFEDKEGSGPSAAAAGLSFEGRTYVMVSSKQYSPEKLISDLDAFVKEAAGRGMSLHTTDLKRLIKRFPGLCADNAEDVSVGAYLLNPLRESYEYDSIAKDHLGIVLKSRKELIEKGALYSAESLGLEAYTADRAFDKIKAGLSENGMLDLYETVEKPLVYALSDMEETGIRVDTEALSAFASYLKGLIVELEQQIYADAGEIFNINSPMQLGNILFEKLGIKGSKKTKTGYSTAADVLHKLSGEYPVVDRILRYRTVTKLYSTYAEGLKAYICGDGRIHGTFNQTVTATGRISSTDPNLQNIPVRTEEGREIRKVFIPRDGYVFLDADYSQIELRILASLSGDEKLIKAYEDSEDIHTLTASEVFHVPKEAVTGQMRSNAKAVNFGIVYGISAFGLGEGLSISRKEALEYIERYFETYPGVKRYLDSLVKEAKEKGRVKTYFGRIRPVPELKSSSYTERAFGERVAMNSPIQGTAADIMKIAMNRVYERLKGTRSKIVLQIHDEFLVETHPDEVLEVRAILKQEMEGAAKFPVKLKADIEQGENWNECH